MASIRSKDMKPELAVPKIAHALGFRFRLHRKDLPGKPDLVFPKYQAVIFVHGCFWHRHPGCYLAYTPKSRKAFWNQKFEGNVIRDKKASTMLRRLGWRVLVVWECELQNHDRLARRLMRGITK